MSAIATPAATPPRAAAPEGGRLKRKAKVPERFQSPSPAKRVRVHPPARAKKPGNGEKQVEKPVAAKRAGKGGKPPRAPAQRHQAYAPVPPADTGVNAMALAALSSPSAAALLGQSPVPEAVAERAMREAAAALDADRTGGLAGLALLLAASSGSPFRADLALAEGACAPKGHKTKGRVAAGDKSAAGPAAPRSAGGGGAAESDDAAKAVSHVRSRETASGSSKPSLGGKRAPDTAVSGDSRRRPPTSAADRNRPVAPASAAAATGATGATRESSPPPGNREPAAEALARGDAAAPAAILKHALRWIDLVVADLKGRAAALRRSRRRLQKVKQDTELASSLNVGATGAGADETLEEEKTLLRDLDRALASESRGVDAQLRAAAELRAVAAGDRAKAMKAFEAAAEAAEAAGDDAAWRARGRGRPKGPAAPREKAVVGPRFVEVTATLRGEGNPEGLRRDPLAPDPAGEAFARCSLALAEAFLKTGLDAAAAEKNGDTEKAATAACPANLVPTPHVPRLATA